MFISHDGATSLAILVNIMHVPTCLNVAIPDAGLI